MVKAQIVPDTVVMELVKSFEDPDIIKIAEKFHKEVTAVSPGELLQEINI